MVIKRITAANPNLTSGRSRTEAQNYWAKTHGHLVANNPFCRVLRFARASGRPV